jgi:hypothetical protein
MFATQHSTGQPRSRKERRVRITEWVHELKKELHWDTYFSRYPEAARTALQQLERIIDEEISNQERSRSLAQA